MKNTIIGISGNPGGSEGNSDVDFLPIKCFLGAKGGRSAKW